MSDKEFLNLELDVIDWNKGHLNVGGRKVFGHPKFSRKLQERLSQEELDPETYGSLLFEALLPEGDSMRKSYRKALEDARADGKLVRLKLTLSLSASEELHKLRWECLYDREEEAALARVPETAFSRYAPIGKDDAVPAVERPRLLLAIASPKDCEQHDMVEIDRESMQRQLDRSLRPLEGRMEWEFLEPPVTPGRLQMKLFKEEFHALHLVAHGYVGSEEETGILVMENSSGKSDFVDERHLSEIFMGNRHLRLLTLMTCHGAVLSHEKPLSGLGRRLVARGLPAVISMQDSVSFEMAEEFSRYFYESLASCGCVDSAVNEARHQLFLEDRECSRWIDPILFMRLENGAIWQPTEKSVEEPAQQVSSKPQPEEQSGRGMQIVNQGSSIGTQVNVDGTASVNPMPANLSPRKSVP